MTLQRTLLGSTLGALLCGVLVSTPAPEPVLGYLRFTESTSKSTPHARPAAEGGQDVLVIELRDADAGGQLLTYSRDLLVRLTCEGSAVLGEDFVLHDEQGALVEQELLLAAGEPRVTLHAEFLVDDDQVAWEDVVIGIAGVREATAERPGLVVPIAVGANDRVRWTIQGDAEAVLQFSHTSPATWPHPSTKVVQAGSTDYWGMRLTDANQRTDDGEIGGAVLEHARRIGVVLHASGSLRVGARATPDVDVVLHDHDPAGPQGDTDGGAGAAVTALAVDQGLVQLTLPADVPGWAVWVEVLPHAPADGTLELRMLEAREPETGARVPVGWNDRIQWVVVH